MSEEEIIKELKLFIVSIKSDLEDDSNEDNFNTMRAVQGLLDLYEKEKEKNKELSNTNKKLYDLAHRQAMQQFIENDYISKDKIKEKLKYYKTLYEIETNRERYLYLKGKYKMLEELLEEE